MGLKSQKLIEKNYQGPRNRLLYSGYLFMQLNGHHHKNCETFARANAFKAGKKNPVSPPRLTPP